MVDGFHVEAFSLSKSELMRCHLTDHTLHTLPRNRVFMCVETPFSIFPKRFTGRNTFTSVSIFLFLCSCTWHYYTVMCILSRQAASCFIQDTVKWWSARCSIVRIVRIARNSSHKTRVMRSEHERNIIQKSSLNILGRKRAAGDASALVAATPLQACSMSLTFWKRWRRWCIFFSIVFFLVLFVLIQHL